MSWTFSNNFGKKKVTFVIVFSFSCIKKQPQQQNCVMPSEFELTCIVKLQILFGFCGHSFKVFLKLYLLLQAKQVKLESPGSGTKNSVVNVLCPGRNVLS